MKAIRDFLHTGLLTASGGPMVVAVVYAILARTAAVRTVEGMEMVRLILTSTLLAFVAGGISVVYRLERLPLLWATLIHFSVLFADYLIIYLWNGWIAPGKLPWFIVCFFGGYFLIWLSVWFSTRRKAQRLSASIQKEGEDERR